MRNKKIIIPALALSSIFIPIAAISCTFEQKSAYQDQISELKQKIAKQKSYIPNYENIQNDINILESQIKSQNLNDKSIQEKIDEIRQTLEKYENNNLNASDFKFEIIEGEFKINKAREIKSWNIRVRDGDTLEAFSENKKDLPDSKIVLRFAGVDTPETHSHKNGKFYDTTGIQYKYGKIAEHYTKRILEEAKKIYIVPQRTKNSANKHLENDKKYLDRYGRTVGIVYYQDSDGKIYCLNEQLVYYGYAKMKYISLSKSSSFYTDNVEYFKSLENAQKHAIDNHLGIYAKSVDIAEIYPNK
ncbi:hypothetical protein DA803_00335 [[Mycoplasma] phocae]|uniref:TNase-like domain-containing protein n=1 Tax=[Mycoplasma] phocae TaxID=142651 RepID=A0A2Z5IPF0_9BACT|nr:thermonuclease family protein [[Mycoplasma] phocae]AXE60549.1 hypothetical protein DA803_00335 [[Mycoplasma] phocae]